MAPMTDEGLIQAVKSFSFLYDPLHTYFHDTKRRDGAWMEIAAKFDKCTGLGCKKRWQVLRDCFRKQLRKRRLSQTAESGKAWRYEASMDFLIPFISARTPEMCSNVSSLNYLPASAENESDEHSSDLNPDFNNDIKFAILDQNAEELASCTKSKEEQDAKNRDSERGEKDLKRCIMELTDIIGAAKRSRGDGDEPQDALAKFFRAMEETVRTFKYPLQIEIKGKIANLVNEYELKNFTDKMESQGDQR